MSGSVTVADNTSVRVAVRVRPLLALEHGNQECLSVCGNQIKIGEGDKHSFTFDHALGQEMSQDQMYTNTVTPMLQGVVEGYNVTLLAYGQTGSGKTYTMGTATDSLSDPTGQLQGIMPRAVGALFEKLEEKRQTTGAEINVTCSMLEIYNESLHDLMVSSLDEDAGGNHSQGRVSLGIREQPDGSIIVPGLRETPVSSVADVLSCIRDGSMNRATSSTNMNATSSRSHMIVTINIEHSGGADVDAGEPSMMTSRLTLVDLAGSERLKRTGATGNRAKEGISINKGLLALGNVINALADDQRAVRVTHVPYRDSKLTRLLQDALGGNSRTLFIACVSPSESNYEETLNTLRYANRARNIRNKAVLNCSPQERMIMLMRAQINMMETELVRFKYNAGKEGPVDDILEQEDVKTYLQGLKEKAGEGLNSTAIMFVPTRRPAARAAARGRVSSAFQHTAAPPAPCIGVPMITLPPKQSQASITFSKSNGIDEMEFIDTELVGIQQEIELAHGEEHFQKESEDHERELDQMESKLKSKEAMLLKIKETIVDYHELQQRFVYLQNEVTSAEGEKHALVQQLAAAEKERDAANNMDSSTAASTKVTNMKKQLDSMNLHIRSLKDEQRINRDAMSRAKSEKTRADMLEKSITELKIAKTKAMHKQASREKAHREWQKKKTGEINALKNTIQKEKRIAGTAARKQGQATVQLQRKNKILQRLQTELKKTKIRMLNMVKQNTKQRRIRARRRSHGFRRGFQRQSIVTNKLSMGSSPAVQDADLEAREHLLAMHVESRVRKVELEEVLQMELQRRDELLHELAIMTKESNPEEDEEDASPERSAIQEHLDSLNDRIEEVEAELVVVTAKCDIGDETASADSTSTADTAFDGISIKQAQHILKRIVAENIEVQQSERVRLACLDKSNAMLTEEITRRKAAEAARDEIRREMKKKIEAYEKNLKACRQKLASHGSQGNAANDFLLDEHGVGKKSFKRVRNSSEDGAREEKRLKHNLSHDGRLSGEKSMEARGSMDSSPDVEQENTVDNSLKLKCHPTASDKERERYRLANIQRKKEKAERERIMREEEELADLKRKGMTRHVLKASKQRRQTDSPGETASAEMNARGRSSSIPSLPDMVF